jgi:type VI secretion system protein ImpI
MAQAFRVRYHSVDSTIEGEKTVSQLPIRIGRNALNHCQIVDRFISDFHAQIELVGDKLCVRDLHSKNGAYTASGRVAPDFPAELTPPKHAFVLGQFIQVEVDVFEQSPRAAGARLSSTVGSVLGNREALFTGGPPDGAPHDAPAPLPPLSAYGAASVARPAFVSPSAGSGWGEAPSMGGVPPLAPIHQGQPPATPPPPGYRDFPNAPRVASVGTQHFTMQVETFALAGLRELASSLVPGAPLTTTGDVARLITKLHDAVEVFCRCFVPLRESYAQFVSQMDLRRMASQRSLNRSTSAMRIETATDPATVASAVLDWRNQDYDVPQTIEGIFADVMIHQIAVIDGVMRGVRALLEELSPQRIEKALSEQPHHGVSALLGRYRALWQTFESRYEELTNETKTFEVVFGPNFAESYREYQSKQRTLP